jgi:hypothetical protein
MLPPRASVGRLPSEPVWHRSFPGSGSGRRAARSAGFSCRPQPADARGIAIRTAIHSAGPVAHLIGRFPGAPVRTTPRPHQVERDRDLQPSLLKVRQALRIHPAQARRRSSGGGCRCVWRRLAVTDQSEGYGGRLRLIRGLKAASVVARERRGEVDPKLFVAVAGRATSVAPAAPRLLRVRAAVSGACCLRSSSGTPDVTASDRWGCRPSDRSRIEPGVDAYRRHR